MAVAPAELRMLHDALRSSTGGHSGPRGGVSAWHARGQGFKSPQLHQPLRFHHSRSCGRVSANCQQIIKSVHWITLSAARFGCS
jgi:hypothetical protein